MRFLLIFSKLELALTDADTIGGVTWKREINSGDDFSYGTAAMAEVKFAILAESLPDGVKLDGRSFDLYISQEESGTPVWEDYGIFTVKTVVKSGHKLEVSAYDNMHKFDIVIDEWLSEQTFPMSYFGFVYALSGHCGVKLESINIFDYSYELEQNFSTPGITGRMALSYASEMAGTFAYILSGNTSGRGKLCLSQISDSGVELDRSMYRTAKVAEYTVLPTDKVQIRTSENDIGVIVGDGDNPLIVENNPLLYTSSAERITPVANALLERMAAVTYAPATVELFRDYGIDTGQYYYINGTKSLVMSKTMKSGGVTFTCTGTAKRSQIVSGQSFELIKMRGRANELERTLERTLSRITDAEGNASEALQTANKIEWIVDSGTSASDFTITDRMAELISDNITLKGKTIALTADSINISSTYFNVDTTGAVSCASLSVTGDRSTIYISANNPASGVIRSTYSMEQRTFSEIRPSGFYSSDYVTQGGGLLSGSGMQISGVNTYGYLSANTHNMYSMTLLNQQTGTNTFFANNSGYNGYSTNVVLVNGIFGVTGSKSKVEPTEHYGNRLMYSLESPNPLYSDFGRASIADDGLCYVFIDPVFYECIDNNYDYFVFVQPENGGEFAVIERTADHFKVQGTPGKSFAWMLVTVQKGYSATRTEEIAMPEPEPVQTPDPENVVYDAVGDEILKEFENQLG